MKKLIPLILIASALIFAVGSVGAYDNGTIGFGQFLIQAGISILVEWLSFKALIEQ